jgi:hypothetical protein
MNQIQPEPAVENFKLNERLWQAWVCKNRELDRASAAMRLRLFLVVLGIIGVAALVQTLTR